MARSLINEGYDTKMFRLEQCSPICAFGTRFPAKANCGEGSEPGGLHLKISRADKQ